MFEGERYRTVDTFYRLARVSSNETVPRAYDYHVHTNYSDGRFLFQMLQAADDAGLDGVGFTDHCNVSQRNGRREAKYQLGFNLDATYERRRAAIDSYRDRVDVAIYDAVEMDYDPRDEDAIREFLDEADFDYAVGSVHAVDDENIQAAPPFSSLSDEEKQGVVDRYFDRLVSLVDSELFEVAAHADLVERNPPLRGFATTEHYERVARAFAESRTVPEINAGRVQGDYGEFHPAPDFLDVLLDRGVDVTVGSDSHFPKHLTDRTPLLAEKFDALDVDPVRIV